MLLGCLLGDAAIVRSSPTSSWRLAFRHGKAQEAYCRFKAEQLADYVTTLPVAGKNRGWGKVTVAFGTVSSPAFDPLAAMVTRDGKKTVTAAWASVLTWESLAYWTMDDGTRQANRIYFCTHGFSKAEVELLSQQLREMGMSSAMAAPVKVRGQTKHIIRLNTDDSRYLSRHIEPWVHPSLQYKLVPERPQVICSVCGQRFPGRKDQAEARDPVCKRRECSLARHRKLSKQSLTEERRRRKNLRARQRAGSQRSSA